MSKQYKTHRHRLDKNYFKPHAIIEEAMQHPPLGTSQEDWNYLETPQQPVIEHHPQRHQEEVSDLSLKAYPLVSHGTKREASKEGQQEPEE
ncbi:unnamed protein product [Ilex paraguariensis]|uniref:Uncharacterized protein n=1 Tax=Ilex paraguariensis TaxID=185542 RepID=A0ABC8SWT9_9AQUA